MAQNPQKDLNYCLPLSVMSGEFSWDLSQTCFGELSALLQASAHLICFYMSS